ncbi:MAG: dTDP-4-amino-4,6-dideoxygalactose transaminase [Verrucomicrobiota bacterium]
MPRYPIPFNLPYQPAKAASLIGEAFANRQVSGAGKFTRQAESMLQSICTTGSCLLTTSCTHALEMAAILLGVDSSSEVIMPSFTFVSTANAFVLRGAKPVFVDIRPDTLNIDETQIEQRITKNTCAIVVVHYGGVACEMERIRDIALRHKVPIVEDNAHGLFGSFHESPLGSLGSLATLSFHETKNVSCGEGGALLINDTRFLEAAKIVREKGTNRSEFAEGKVEKYNWVGLGSSYVPSEILAAFLVAALEDAPKTQMSRHHAWQRYKEELTPWAQRNGVQLPIIPPSSSHPAHLFYLLFPNRVLRDHAIVHLKERGILSVFHYLPLEQSPMALALDLKNPPCPVSTRVSDTILRLPLYNEMPDESINTVVQAVTEIRL